MSPRLLRFGYLAGFLICAALLGAAYYFEIVLYMEPCPLCIVQRLATLLIGIGCLLAFIFDGFRWMSRLALALTTGASVFGAVVANHHIWIQGLPPEEVPACGPSFDYLLETLPMNELINIMLHGNGNCADISWMFWGMSMPEWTRLFFIVFAIISLITLIAKWRSNGRKA
ncbi:MULTISPECIES: disulfide bond formation protein B [unclassified Oceanobacter]|jgi:disulfide bond formation protein DsbB|uniref:disulfide bond formation protein B n=1 Tax=unclassified Oceanobacter TaxID=2620260 RepID=UPI0026E428F5|nr:MULTISPECIES: disulfide bond formation protein B [unclassified Oceanobacter]MDO6680756.1 disulfide bond formation protein B [Oceanobacter sp. 5_MG-2023]MDP2504524.1 disulfide bond formation protein B [Oceanobacter sp. 3_MG-2023]MDP2547022.1 disulfide bond formation protein B [Oceanobacter sp. 4_MG-2023]MDP2607847.1 disulfide bond formation protein B [Oceanobacter sp. 1_MG-2023]MDP2610969.1 disulfide bond formation protein B [Oceanobacter sp. 2_MG-2023]